MSFEQFQSEVSRLKSQLRNLDEALQSESLNELFDHAEIDQLRETWNKIDNNACLCMYVTLHDYRSLKFETSQMIEKASENLKQRVAKKTEPILEVQESSVEDDAKNQENKLSVCDTEVGEDSLTKI